MNEEVLASLASMLGVLFVAVSVPHVALYLTRHNIRLLLNCVVKQPFCYSVFKLLIFSPLVVSLTDCGSGTVAIVTSDGRMIVVSTNTAILCSADTTVLCSIHMLYCIVLLISLFILNLSS